MAKLYAELTSDKGGRIASKGGDKQIVIELVQGNTCTHFVTYDSRGLTVKKMGVFTYNDRKPK